MSLGLPYRQANDVLYCLGAYEDTFGIPLNRVALQSILYFACVLSPLADIRWDYTFTRARFGTPINRDTIKAADAFGVSGLVTTTPQIGSTPAMLRNTYRITPEGQDRLRALLTLASEAERAEWVEIVVRSLRTYPSVTFSKMTLAEPNLVGMKLRNDFGVVYSEDNRSLLLVEVIVTELEAAGYHLGSPAHKVIPYFDLLSDQIGKLEQDAVPN